MTTSDKQPDLDSAPCDAGTYTLANSNGSPSNSVVFMY